MLSQQQQTQQAQQDLDWVRETEGNTTYLADNCQENKQEMKIDEDYFAHRGTTGLQIAGIVGIYQHHLLHLHLYHHLFF